MNNMKFLMILMLIFSSCLIKGQCLNTDSISNSILSGIDSLKLEYEKAIQIINDQERQAIFPRDSICKSIEIK